MNNELRVLFTATNDKDIDLICQKIKDFGYNVLPEYADSEDSMMRCFKSSHWDMLITLSEETNSITEETALILSVLEVTAPWIMIYSSTERNEIIQALEAGCRDAIDISELDRLEFVIYRLLIETERENINKAKQEKLIAEKEKLALTLGSIGDGVITVGTNERIVMMNNGAEMITGWLSDLAINRPLNEVFKVVDKNTGKPMDNLLNLTVNSGDMIGLKRDTVLISKNGDEKFVSACISPIRVLEDTIGVVIVFRDISRIRQTEEKLITEQQNLTLIFDAAPIGMLLLDENAIIKKVNKLMLNIVNRHEQEVINQKLGNGLGCINSDKNNNGCGFSDECVNCKLQSTLFEISSSKESMIGLETHYTLLVDGAEKDLWLNINSVPVTIDDQKHVMLVIDDITNRKTAEEGLRRYQLLSQYTNDIIMFSNIDDRIIEANSAALLSYGYTREEILNKSIFELVKPDSRSPVRTQPYKSNAEGVYYEAIARRKDGSTFTVEVSLQSAEIGNSKVLLSIQRDITERKLVQKELEGAREYAEAANLAKSEFLANMSHEIRTPLNGMLGMIDLTLLTALTQEQKDNLFTAKSCASTLLNLINDILDFSRIEARKLTLENIGFDFLELIEQTMKPHNIKAQGKGLKLRYQLDPHINHIINGDPYRLKQVINNLLGNAIKFTDIGEIVLFASLKNSTDDYVEIEFQISDTGVGIDSKDIGRIFDTFSQADNSVTRKYGGSGLGLAITRQLVEMMEGIIWVESEKGKGSTFFFTVKLAIGMVMQSSRHNIEPIVKAKQPLKILLAEDDRVNQLVIGRMIKDAGHIVETANNGVEALLAINEKSIDLVLMDIQMPEMDGIGAVKRVRKSEKGTQRHIPIIALTAYALQGDREKYLSVGMDDYIAKPVQISSLLETIEKVAERSKIKKQHKTFVENEYDHNHSNIEHKELMIEHSKNVERIINSISMSMEHLKASLEKKDLSLVEKFANEIKQLSSEACANSIRSAIFKVELAARRESIGSATEHFNHVLEELDKFKRRYINYSNSER